MKKKHNCSEVVIANCHIGLTVPAAVNAIEFRAINISCCRIFFD